MPENTAVSPAAKPTGIDYSLRSAERDAILRAMDVAGWNVTIAAKLLRVYPRQLQKKLQYFDIGGRGKHAVSNAATRGRELLRLARQDLKHTYYEYLRVTGRVPLSGNNLVARVQALLDEVDAVPVVPLISVERIRQKLRKVNELSGYARGAQ